MSDPQTADEIWAETRRDCRSSFAWRICRWGYRRWLDWPLGDGANPPMRVYVQKKMYASAMLPYALRGVYSGCAHLAEEMSQLDVYLDRIEEMRLTHYAGSTLAGVLFAARTGRVLKHPAKLLPVAAEFAPGAKQAERQAELFEDEQALRAAAILEGRA